MQADDIGAHHSAASCGSGALAATATATATLAAKEATKGAAGANGEFKGAFGANGAPGASAEAAETTTLSVITDGDDFGRPARRVLPNAAPLLRLLEALWTRCEAAGVSGAPASIVLHAWVSLTKQLLSCGEASPLELIESAGHCDNAGDAVAGGAAAGASRVATTPATTPATMPAAAADAARSKSALELAPRAHDGAAGRRVFLRELHVSMLQPASAAERGTPRLTSPLGAYLGAVVGAAVRRLHGDRYAGAQHGGGAPMQGAALETALETDPIVGLLPSLLLRLLQPPSAREARANDGKPAAADSASPRAGAADAATGPGGGGGGSGDSGGDRGGERGGGGGGGGGSDLHVEIPLAPLQSLLEALVTSGAVESARDAAAAAALFAPVRAEGAAPSAARPEQMRVPFPASAAPSAPRLAPHGAQHGAEHVAQHGAEHVAQHGIQHGAHHGASRLIVWPGASELVLAAEDSNRRLALIPSVCFRFLLVASDSF